MLFSFQKPSFLLTSPSLSGFFSSSLQTRSQMLCPLSIIVHPSSLPALQPPEVDNSSLIASFNLSLVGRLFHRDGRSIEALLAFMPRASIWDVEGRVRGFDLGNSRFQFDFQTEEDLLKVLKRRPCHFNKWSFSLERWQPHVEVSFPKFLTFWVKISGLPSHFWLEEILDKIGKALGKVTNHDTHNARIEVVVDGDLPLKFQNKAKLSSGEILDLSFKYEKLYRWCFTCGLISHEERSCPLLNDQQRQERLAARESVRERSQTEEEDSLRSIAAGPGTLPNSNSNPSLVRRPNSANHQGPRGMPPPRYAVRDFFDSRRDNLRDKTNQSAFKLKSGKSVDYNPYSKDRLELSLRNVRHSLQREGYNLERSNVWSRSDKRHKGDRDLSHGEHRRNGFYQGESSNFSSLSLRKRRFEGSSDSTKRIEIPKRTKDVPRRKNTAIVIRSRESSPTRISNMDSQRTISGIPSPIRRAKPAHIDPLPQEERPFRLSLRKKGKSQPEEKAADIQESSRSQSSAKKRLLFNEELAPPPLPNHPPPAALQTPSETEQIPLSREKSKSLHKSWYEMTLEEEEDEVIETVSEAPQLAVTSIVEEERLPALLETSPLQQESQLDKIDGEEYLGEEDWADANWEDYDDLLGDDPWLEENIESNIDPDLNLLAPLEEEMSLADEANDEANGGVEAVPVDKISAYPISETPDPTNPEEVIDALKEIRPAQVLGPVGMKKRIPKSPVLVGFSTKQRLLGHIRISPKNRTVGLPQAVGPNSDGTNKSPFPQAEETIVPNDSIMEEAEIETANEDGNETENNKKKAKGGKKKPPKGQP